MSFDDSEKLFDRILLDLKNVLLKYPMVDEFDILPVSESVQNKSPVIHVENKLAFESWCVKPLYIYVYNKFFDSRRKKLKVDSSTVLLWTSAILLINPDIDTVWNCRKELSNSLEALNTISTITYVSKLKDELKFSELILSRKPKSSPVFAHRKWILLKLREMGKIIPKIITQELTVCSHAASRYANNYHAWCHRSWIIQELLSTCHRTVSDELAETEEWVSTHISDHSGFQYRQFLMSCFQNDASTNPSNCLLHKSVCSLDSENRNCYPPLNYKQKMFQHTARVYKELILLSNWQTDYPGHEALWYHRRYLLHEFKKMESNEELCFLNKESLEDSLQVKRHKTESDFNSKWNSKSEDCFINQRIAAAKNNSWEQILILRHLKWLNNVLLWPVSSIMK